MDLTIGAIKCCPVPDKPNSPIKNSNTFAEEQQGNSEKIQCYSELVKLVSNIEGFINVYENETWKGAKESLAFLVEATNQLHPEQWKDTINDVKTKILKLNDKTEVSWLLLQAIQVLYESVLALRILEAKEQGNTHQSMDFSRTLNSLILIKIGSINQHRAGKPVFFNIVRKEFVPSWFDP